jgi:hypothetical protein
MMILLMELEVIREVSDTLTQEGDLNLGRSGVLRMLPVLSNDVGFPLWGECQNEIPLLPFLFFLLYGGHHSTPIPRCKGDA